MRIFICLMTLFPFKINAQIEGCVFDQQNNEPIEFANIFIQGTSIGVISNNEGMFKIHIPDEHLNKNIIISYIGYKTDTIFSPHYNSFQKPLNIGLIQQPTQLSEVVIKHISSLDILKKAVNSISKNYSKASVYLYAYYREMVETNGSFVKYADAACKISYCAYNIPFNKEQSSHNFYQLNYENWTGTMPFPQVKNNVPHQDDQVQIIEMRKSDDFESFTNRWDFEKGLKKFEISGGPLSITAADIVKIRKDMINPETWKYYKFKCEGIVNNNNRQTYKISFKPNKKTEKAVWQGLMYIDKESYAFVGFEYSVYKESIGYIRDKNIEIVVELGKERKKKKLKPIIKRTVENTDQKVRVSYSNFRDKWYLSHIRIKNSFKNSGDFFESISYNTYLDLYINDIQTQNIPELRKEDTYFTNKFNYLFQHRSKYDPTFWINYNTPVPSSLYKRALIQLEKNKTLQEQFQEN